jgi:phosphoesterase RecJ-like protein
MKPNFDQNKIESVKALISSSKHIVITTHFKPDGDALGSSLGLWSYLKAIGHQVQIILPSEFPGFLKWMHGSDQTIDFLKFPEEAKAHFEKADLIFCLDFNDPSRTEGLHPVIVNSSAKKIMIDHHLAPKDFCDYTFSFPAIGSTCELIVHFIEAMDGLSLISMESAACLYAGIMTDTGSFRFSSVTAETHRVIGVLLNTGMRNDIVHEAVYDTSSEDRLRFLGHVLLNKMFVVSEYKTVYFLCTSDDMKRFNHQSGDLEGIVNYGLSIEGIKMSVLFSEREGIVKISFRSKGDFSVKDLAEKHFEGGGHKNAAGGKSHLTLEDTVVKFNKILTELNHG